MLSMHERRKSVSSASVIWYTILFRQNRTDRPTAPEIESFAEVTREQVLAYAAFLETEISTQTGKPLTAWTKRNYLAAVSQFFQQAAEWQWEDMPDRHLLIDSDRPKMTL